MDLKSIFYGGEFLGDGSTHGIDRRDCLPYQLLILDDTALVGLCQKFYLLFKSESLIIDGLFKKIKLFRNSFGLIQKRIHQSAVIIRQVRGLLKPDVRRVILARNNRCHHRKGGKGGKGGKYFFHKKIDFVAYAS